MFKTPLRLVGLTAALAATGGACFSLGAAVTSTATGPGAVTLASDEVAGPAFRFVSRSFDPGPSDTFQRSATCPVGYRAMAGGGHTSQTNLFMTDSIRNTNSRSWDVRWETEGNATTNPTDVTVVVLCKNLDA